MFRVKLRIGDTWYYLTLRQWPDPLDWAWTSTRAKAFVTPSQELAQKLVTSTCLLSDESGMQRAIEIEKPDGSTEDIYA
jgi:hypothetical protein